MQTELTLTSPPIMGLPFRGWDFIYAKHPAPDERPEWYTEKRFPLNGELVEQGAYLYGVRFGQTTQYAMVDIDHGSAWHPSRDPFAVQQICEALEPLGLVRSLLCQSSNSGGLHLYFPWTSNALKSWQVGLVLAVLLESKGFKPSPGHLEIFPNPKPYRGKEPPSLYNAHRLPLQRGFYLLDDAFQPTWTTQDKFLAQWQSAAAANTVCEDTKEHLLKQYQRRQYPVSTSAEKFLNDLNAAIEPGWARTEDHPPFLWEGQTIIPKTNPLLGRITMRAYIFGHIDGRHPPLEGDNLIDEIVKVAINLPGYQDYCHHQHEIRKRASEWARCIENSHYFHYGIKKKPKAAPVEITWHEEKAKAAREKITDAIAELLEQGTFPSSATARTKLLVERCKTSLATLYKNKDLWHPDHIHPQVERSETREKENDEFIRAVEGAKNPSYKNLLVANTCNTPQSYTEQGITEDVSEAPTVEFKNTESAAEIEPNLSDDPAIAQQNCAEESVNETIERVKRGLKSHQNHHKVEKMNQDLDVEAQLHTEQQHQHRSGLRQWLATGDPILMREAIKQLNNGR